MNVSLILLCIMCVFSTAGDDNENNVNHNIAVYGPCN